MTTHKEVAMTVVKWAPFRELDSMDRQLRRFFGDFGLAPGFIPAADYYETDKEFVIELEVPGFAEKELDVETFDHTLVVKGERTEVKEPEDKTFRLRERLEKVFERRFLLPTEADTTHLKATFQDGVLEVHAPKLEISKPHRVEIVKA
jgi:HSP20 family protein